CARQNSISGTRLSVAENGRLARSTSPMPLVPGMTPRSDRDDRSSRMAEVAGLRRSRSGSFPGGRAEEGIEGGIEKQVLVRQFYTRRCDKAIEGREPDSASVSIVPAEWIDEACMLGIFVIGPDAATIDETEYADFTACQVNVDFPELHARIDIREQIGA